MKLLAYLESRTAEERDKFLRKLKRQGIHYHPNHIRACATGRRKTSNVLARLIEKVTGGEVTRWELRPDIWDRPDSR